MEGRVEAAGLGDSDWLTLRRQRQVRWVKTNMAYSDYELERETGFDEIGRSLDATKVTRRSQAILEKAGLPRQRFHDLRHAAATYMLSRVALFVWL